MCNTKIPIHIRCFIMLVLNFSLLDWVFIYLRVFRAPQALDYSPVCSTPI